MLKARNRGVAQFGDIGRVSRNKLITQEIHTVALATDSFNLRTRNKRRRLTKERHRISFSLPDRY